MLLQRRSLRLGRRRFFFGGRLFLGLGGRGCAALVCRLPCIVIALLSFQRRLPAVNAARRRVKQLVVRQIVLGVYGEGERGRSAKVALDPWYSHPPKSSLVANSAGMGRQADFESVLPTSDQHLSSGTHFQIWERGHGVQTAANPSKHCQKALTRPISASQS